VTCLLPSRRAQPLSASTGARDAVGLKNWCPSTVARTASVCFGGHAHPARIQPLVNGGMALVQAVIEATSNGWVLRVPVLVMCAHVRADAFVQSLQTRGGVGLCVLLNPDARAPCSRCHQVRGAPSGSVLSSRSKVRAALCGKLVGERSGQFSCKLRRARLPGLTTYAAA
jgi:hypothetical protein